MKKPSDTWYGYGDARYKELQVKISKVFRKELRLAAFDEINASRAQIIATTIYTILQRMNRKYFRDLWEHCYEFEYDWLAMYGWFPEFGELDKPKDNEQIAKTAKSKSRKGVDVVLGRYDPVTKYVYTEEADRKRSRFFESVVADGEAKNRLEFEKDFKTAEKLWQRQTKQYFINVEDDARRKALTDVAQDKDPLVMWRTMEDEKVCPECDALNGLVFRLSQLPPKPHMNCRCQWLPYREKNV